MSAAARSAGRPKEPASRTLAAWAEFLGCGTETLRRAIRRGELLATKDPLKKGPPYVVTAIDMNAFLEKRRLGR